MTRREEDFTPRDVTGDVKKSKRQRRLDEADDQQWKLMARSDQRRSSRQAYARLTDVSDAAVQAMIENQKPANLENTTSPFSLRRSDWASLGWQQFTKQRPWYAIDCADARISNGVFATNAPSHSNASTLLPWPRGPLSDYVISTLGSKSRVAGLMPAVQVGNPLGDDDFQLALYLCYELHYRGEEGAKWEWDPSLITFRGELERTFLHALQKPNVGDVPVANILKELDAVIAKSRGETVSAHLAKNANVDKIREYLVHCSIQELKGSDAQSFGVARLSGAARTALIQMQFGDSGCGVATASMENLFGDTMTALQLDPTPGVYVGHLPGVSLATANLTSFFSMHRRWRGAMVGQVAATKIASSVSVNECRQALGTLGVERDVLHSFDVRSRNEALHALLARNRLIPGFLGTDAGVATDILFGACSQLEIATNFNHYVLRAWSKNHSSLLPWGATPHGGVPHEGDRVFHERSSMDAGVVHENRVESS